MSYADAAKKYKSNNDSKASENVNSDSQSNVVTSFENSKSSDLTNKDIDNDFIRNNCFCCSDNKLFQS